MNLDTEFELEKISRIAEQGEDRTAYELAINFLVETAKYKYSYNFSWLGRPIIQFPQDMVATQEIIWQIKPDLIIETGIAHGGSLIFYASLLELIGKGEVLGIDIEIRPHNRQAIEAHPLFKHITMFEGSSIDPVMIAKVHKFARGKDRILVCLDSNHTHNHVLAELNAYAPLVSVGSYCVVFDTIVEDMPAEMFPDRPWGPGNNPKTAVREYLKTHPEFEIDKQMDHKLLISVAPDGYLRRIR